MNNPPYLTYLILNEAETIIYDSLHQAKQKDTALKAQ